MSRAAGLRIFCFLIGGAVGAGFSDVSWTWWIAWSVAMGSWLLVANWHRSGRAVRA